MSTHPVPAPRDEPRDWYFTFGVGRRFGGRNGYVKINGTYDVARQSMIAMFDYDWSHQYASADDAGVDRFNLVEVDCVTGEPFTPIESSQPSQPRYVPAMDGDEFLWQHECEYILVDVAMPEVCIACTGATGPETWRQLFVLEG